MKTLKLIADWRFNEEPKNSTPIENIPHEERDNNSFWYLHGKLEEFVGYDKAIAINCKTLGISKFSYLFGDFEMHFTGIIPVKIEGIRKACIGYFWTDDFISDGEEAWNQRGLVCFKDDKDSCEYAESQYKNKSHRL